MSNITGKFKDARQKTIEFSTKLEILAREIRRNMKKIDSNIGVQLVLKIADDTLEKYSAELSEIRLSTDPLETSKII